MSPKSGESIAKARGRTKLEDQSPNEATGSTTKKDDTLIRVNKKYLNPFVPLWLAILFFAMDYLVYQKQLSGWTTWILNVIPLLLKALSFFFFALRKQFPWISFPLDPLLTSSIIFEQQNVYYAILLCLVFVFLAVVFTIAFFFHK